MDLHACLWNEVQAFNFSGPDFDPLKKAFPDLNLVVHETEKSFLDQANQVDLLMTWDFDASWYEKCPRLKKILTPAAGKDWVESDPSGQIEIIHGTFHGGLLAESLLSALLFMNHKMPDMWRNFSGRLWDREIQTKSRLLANQNVLIIGYGSIGRACGEMISGIGTKVVGISRRGTGSSDRIPVYPVSNLEELLPEADHVVLLLPGISDTDGFLNERLIRCCKPGVMLYNFGRGNALRSSDLISSWDHVGGAFLDVTDEEPLPSSSPLWELDNIMITPHSSCIYSTYKGAFITEAIDHLRALVT